MPFLSLESFLSNLGNKLQYTAEFVPKALKQLFFVLVVLTFITPEICPVFTLSSNVRCE